MPRRCNSASSAEAILLADVSPQAFDFVYGLRGYYNSASGGGFIA